MPPSEPPSPPRDDAGSGAVVVPITEAVTRRRRKAAREARETLEGCYDELGGEESGHEHFTMLGNMSLIEGDAEEAIACFSRALELQPEDGSALVGRGRVRMALWEVDLALEDFDRALALSPDEGRLHYFRGYCLSQRMHARFERGLEDIDESEEELNARCEAALASLERAVALGFDGVNVYYELVGVHEQMGDDDAIMAMLDRAIQAVPTEPCFLLVRESRRRLRGDAAGAAADRMRLKEMGFERPSD